MKWVQFWKRSQIETEIAGWSALITKAEGNPPLKEILAPPAGLQADNRASSVLTSYAAAYRKMTAERDLSRCDKTPGNAMRASSDLLNQINHGLADLMTRNLVNISKACLLDSFQDSGYAVEPLHGRWELCDLYFDTATTFRNRYNSMTVVLSTTVIYLTSHIAASLAALPFLDRLWVGTELQGNTSITASSSALLQRRIALIEDDYRSSFRVFNPFLVVNMDTVSRALWADGQLSGRSIEEISVVIEARSGFISRLI
jgi:hypothetical protein